MKTAKNALLSAVVAVGIITVGGGATAVAATSTAPVLASYVRRCQMVCVRRLSLS
jgi:hypothetical protein